MILVRFSLGIVVVSLLLPLSICQFRFSIGFYIPACPRACQYFRCCLSCGVYASRMLTFMFDEASFYLDVISGSPCLD